MPRRPSQRRTIGTDRLEVLVVDGGSTDGSREFVETGNDGQVDPPARTTRQEPPHRRVQRRARAARGDVICSSPRTACRDVLSERQRLGPGALGRPRRRRPATAMSVSIRSPVRSGWRWSPRSVWRHRTDSPPSPPGRHDQPPRLSSRRRFARSCHSTSALERNADYELNWRMRAAGMVLWFDPGSSRCIGHARTFGALARQFWWYGRWKARVVRACTRQPSPVVISSPPRPRCSPCLAPLIALSRVRSRFLVGPAPLSPPAWGPSLSRTPSEHGASPPWLLAAAFPAMHMAWGLGFLALRRRILWRSDMSVITRPVRTALVGYGYWGVNLARTLRLGRDRTGGCGRPVDDQRGRASGVTTLE